MTEHNTCPVTRTETDLLGDREVPEHAYYGIQTMRAMKILISAV